MHLIFQRKCVGWVERHQQKKKKNVRPSTYALMLVRAQNRTNHSETQRRSGSGNLNVGFHFLYLQDGVVVRQILLWRSRGFVFNRSTQPTRLSINRVLPHGESFARIMACYK